ncbi:plastocyanin/azurin family copper-binding protein [Roseisolibacter sp. H3M3-2]|uniref:plastocyanin/azurin family copper-binding protein n=1 Tax=Roseisolibacter sp. H3M3-2 TaxID=3031323 RepID=UPI0023D9F7D0|nr:plastocyanin/azurin family copper-binding protein [Roseisolibacter sp. H3M3-2]MDF1504084.1 plastocyanin/azurin family copper-binding protein [Roseisolibacter sp. H3M3-2]
MASALVLAACGGNKDNAADTAAAAPAATDAAAPAPATDAAASTATAQPATGKTHTVNMVGDEKGYRFEPANLTIAAGDAVDFIMVSGGPHNVAFDQAAIPAAGAAQLTANIPNAAAPLTSQMMLNPNEKVTISFAGVAPGTYNYNCTPHLAMGMKGVITVQ